MCENTMPKADIATAPKQLNHLCFVVFLISSCCKSNLLCVIISKTDLCTIIKAKKGYIN